MEQVILRHRAVCQVCASRLPPRSEAWWDEATDRATCPTCYRLAALGTTVDAAPTAPEQADGAAEGPATSGSRPSREGAAPEGRVVDQAVVDRLRAAVDSHQVDGPADDEGAPADDGTPPLSARTIAPVAPAAPPRRVSRDLVALASILDAAVDRGVTALHHRSLPGSSDVVDHLVLAPNGLWIVTATEQPEGRVERRDVGDWFSPDHRLYVADRDRADLLERARGVAERVVAALAGTRLAEVPHRGVLCFAAAPPRWLSDPFVLGDISVTVGRHLVEPMLASVTYGPTERTELLRHLVVRFPAA